MSSLKILEVRVLDRKTGDIDRYYFQVEDIKQARAIVRSIRSKRAKVIYAGVVFSWKEEE